MVKIICDFINSLSQYAYDHSVNPYIFCALYLISIPIFYYPFIYVGKIIRNGNNKETYKKYIFKGIIISSVAYLMPLAYIILFGRNLSLWLILVIFVIIFVNVIMIINKYKIKDRS